MARVSDYHALVEAENDAQDAYDDWCEAHPEPKYKYELRRGKDKLGRPGGWYVRNAEYAAWCKERDRQWARVLRRIKKVEAHPQDAIERARWRASRS